jgi:hypothetical protein
MMRSILVFLLMVFCGSVTAQIIPTEGDTLNYRIVGFSCPKNTNAAKYIFKVSSGKYSVSEEKAFAEHIVAESKPGSNKQVLELLEFGKEYTWAISYIDKQNKLHAPTVYHHFTVGQTSAIDNNFYRLRIITPTTFHEDALVIIDNTGVMYTMSGVPVWYLPQANNSVVDLKATTTGTFTYLDNEGAYEVDYNGKPLWKAPDNGKVNGEETERYHHQFTKLNNRHYMVMGMETVLRPMSDNYVPADSMRDKMVFKDNVWFAKVDAGTLIEYDANGTVAWSWKASSGYENDSYFGRQFQQSELSGATGINSFYFDEKNKCIYVCFEAISTIVKIKYPSGEVVKVFGKAGDEKRQERVKRFPFKAPHYITMDKKGDIYLFNTNKGYARSKISTIAVFHEEPKANVLKKLRDYPCSPDSTKEFITMNGGSVHVFSDTVVFAATGSASRMFIVDRERYLDWDAMPEYKDATGKWVPLPYNKASVIEKRAEFEKMIMQNLKR